jgi:hypothetical protein
MTYYHVWCEVEQALLKRASKKDRVECAKTHPVGALSVSAMAANLIFSHHKERTYSIFCTFSSKNDKIIVQAIARWAAEMPNLLTGQRDSSTTKRI